MQSGFHNYRFLDALKISDADVKLSSELTCCVGKKNFSNVENVTYFGFVTKDSIKIKISGMKDIELTENQFFAINKSFQIEGSGQAVVFTKFNYQGMINFGGPIENFGRLSYIDNCRTTILVHPNKVGDPCLHHLLFPARTQQSAHSHPTERLGYVNKGSGDCVLASQRIALNKGDVFLIKPNILHHFESSSEGLEVISYHPDSNTGPTDEVHPMRSATFVERD